MRIGINISNGLHQRLKAIGEPVNVSLVCRDAIEAVVVEHEELAARVDGDGLRAVVDGFADDGEQWSDIDWREYGWTDAGDWFKTVTREQYARFVRYREAFLKRPRLSQEILWLVQSADPTQGGVGFQKRLEEHRDLYEKELDRLEDWSIDGFPYGDAKREYETAWLTYFNVIHKLIEDTRKQRAEESRRNRAQFPEPELPEHLV